jgi:(hydroxyamino)benzene mutase
MKSTRRRLFWHGMVLFMLGLLTGFIIPALTNPRAGLAAHLEGVMNGTFLVVLGLVWHELRLSSRLATTAFRMALFGTYVNWFCILLSGVWGTSRMTPIAGDGFEGASWQEMFVNTGLITLSVAMVGCLGIIIWGLRGESPEE